MLREWEDRRPERVTDRRFMIGFFAVLALLAIGAVVGLG